MLIDVVEVVLFEDVHAGCESKELSHEVSESHRFVVDDLVVEGTPENTVRIVRPRLEHELALLDLTSLTVVELALIRPVLGLVMFVSVEV